MMPPLPATLLVAVVLSFPLSASIWGQPVEESSHHRMATRSPSGNTIPTFLLPSSAQEESRPQQRTTTMKQKTLSLTTDYTVPLDIISEQLLTYRRRECRLRIVAIRSQLNRALASLSKVGPLAVATFCRGESAAAAEMWISRRQRRKARTEVCVECECRGLREFLSTDSDRSDWWVENQWNKVSQCQNRTKAGTP